jgi:hypothetical protein
VAEVRVAYDEGVANDLLSEGWDLFQVLQSAKPQGGIAEAERAPRLWHTFVLVRWEQEQ